MNGRIRRQLDVCKRVQQFGLDHPSNPSNAAAAAAYTALDTAISQIETLHSRQFNGNNVSLGATQERRLRRKQLRSDLNDLSRVAKTLDNELFPDIAAQLKIGRLNSYASMLASANIAIVVMTAINQAFIDHGAPATLIEDVQSSMNGLVATIRRGFSGRGTRIASSAVPQTAARGAMKQVRVLVAI